MKSFTDCDHPNEFTSLRTEIPKIRSETNIIRRRKAIYPPDLFFKMSTLNGSVIYSEQVHSMNYIICSTYHHAFRWQSDDDSYLPKGS